MCVDRIVIKMLGGDDTARSPTDTSKFPSYSSPPLTQELNTQLEISLREIENLKDSRDKQKEIIQAIVNQKEMYRTLLAQATPLPDEPSPGRSRTKRYSGGRGMDGEEEDGIGDERLKEELEDIKEKFAAYRKEKAENDSIVQKQEEKLRNENSEVKIQNAKLSSKVCICGLYIIVNACGGLYIIVGACILWRLVYHYGSLDIIGYHCGSLYIIMGAWISLDIIVGACILWRLVYHYGSLYIIVEELVYVCLSSELYFLA